MQKKSSFISPDENSFSFKVPVEDEAYIFSIQYVFELGKHYYYSENGTTDHILLASPVYYNQEASSIEFDMTNFVPPYPIISKISESKIHIRKIMRTQDVLYNVTICFYDEKGQLQKVLMENYNLTEYSGITIYLDTNKYEQYVQDAHSIKVFIWDGHMIPLMLPAAIEQFK